MAAKKKRRKISKRKKVTRKKRGRKVRKVLVLKNGSMKSVTGKKVIWNNIAENAKFFHEK